MAISKVNYGNNVLLDLTGDTIKKEKLLSGFTAHDASGEQITGTMINNGAIIATIDGLSSIEYIIPIGYHSGSGKISLANDIENALAAI